MTASLYRFEILERILRVGVVGIFRDLDTAQSLALAEQLVAERITAIEVTLNSPGALETIAALRRDLTDEVVVGAGTVLDGAAATQAILAGAQFIVSPNLRIDVLRATHNYGKVAIPGAMTPGEIAAACAQGADLVKVFPAATLGAAYFRDLRAPLNHVPLMATGGIDAKNAADFVAAGAVALGVGGALTRRELIETQRWQEIRAIARQIRQATEGRPAWNPAMSVVST